MPVRPVRSTTGRSRPKQLRTALAKSSMVVRLDSTNWFRPFHSEVGRKRVFGLALLQFRGGFARDKRVDGEFACIMVDLQLAAVGEERLEQRAKLGRQARVQRPLRKIPNRVLSRLTDDRS